MNLDMEFGKLRSPFPEKTWEKGATPISLCRLDQKTGIAISHYVHAFNSHLFKFEVQRKLLIWAMDVDGNVWLAFEESTNGSWDHIGDGFAHRVFQGEPNPRYTAERKLGHPTLMGADRPREARIAGEFKLFLEVGEKATCKINASSGRYHKGTNSPPTVSQLRAVAGLFTRYVELPVLIDMPLPSL